jgi:hypothetical protein
MSSIIAEFSVTRYTDTRLTIANIFYCYEREKYNAVASGASKM